jgi:uncharacterized repeat protein (TIGR01451 family)
MIMLHRLSLSNRYQSLTRHLSVRILPRVATLCGIITSVSLLGSGQSVMAQVPITGITASYFPSSASSVTTVGAGTSGVLGYSATPYTLNFGQGQDLVMTSIGVGGMNYSVQQISDYISIRRVNNSVVSGIRNINLFERVSRGGATLSLGPSFANTMEEVLLSNIINRGADNVFANQGDKAGNNNNIERIDLITAQGIKAPSTTAKLDKVGFVILDRKGGGYDRFKIAAITAIDSANNPTAFGPLVSVTSSSSSWGLSSYPINTTVLRRDGAGIFTPSTDVAPPAQSIAGTFISYNALGVTTGQKIYGYALFAADVDALTMNLITLSGFPTNTDDTVGGLDLLAGGLSFAEYPTTDLEITKTDNKTSTISGTSNTYTITVKNNGSSALSSLKVVDTLPAALQTPVFTPSAGSYNSTTGDWTGLGLNPGASITLQVSGTIAPGFSGPLTNTAQVFPPSGTEDYNSDNDQATDTTLVYASSLPSLHLVKRITKIRGTAITSYVDLVGDPKAADDNQFGWSNPTATAQRVDGMGTSTLGTTPNFSTFLAGAIDPTNIPLPQRPQPGDVIEYTIYFLSDGGQDAKNVALCDFIPANTSYVSDSLQLVFNGSTSPVTDLVDGDGGLYKTGAPTSVCQATDHGRGAVVINVGNVVKSAGSGTPSNSYGLFRFQVKVN